MQQPHAGPERSPPCTGPVHKGISYPIYPIPQTHDGPKAPWYRPRTRTRTPVARGGGGGARGKALGSWRIYAREGLTRRPPPLSWRRCSNQATEVVRVGGSNGGQGVGRGGGNVATGVRQVTRGRRGWTGAGRCYLVAQGPGPQPCETRVLVPGLEARVVGAHGHGTGLGGNWLARGGGGGSFEPLSRNPPPPPSGLP